MVLPSSKNFHQEYNNFNNSVRSSITVTEAIKETSIIVSQSDSYWSEDDEWNKFKENTGNINLNYHPSVNSSNFLPVYNINQQIPNISPSVNSMLYPQIQNLESHHSNYISNNEVNLSLNADVEDFGSQSFNLPNYIHPNLKYSDHAGSQQLYDDINFLCSNSPSSVFVNTTSITNIANQTAYNEATGETLSLLSSQTISLITEGIYGDIVQEGQEKLAEAYQGGNIHADQYLPQNIVYPETFDDPSLQNYQCGEVNMNLIVSTQPAQYLDLNRNFQKEELPNQYEPLPYSSRNEAPIDDGIPSCSTFISHPVKNYDFQKEELPNQYEPLPYSSRNEAPIDEGIPSCSTFISHPVKNYDYSDSNNENSSMNQPGMAQPLEDLAKCENPTHGNIDAVAEKLPSLSQENIKNFFPPYLPAFTPAGQAYRINRWSNPPNFAKENIDECTWCIATLLNSKKARLEIEEGLFLPESLDKSVEERFKSLIDKKVTKLKEWSAKKNPFLKHDLLFLENELWLSELDRGIRQYLLTDPEVLEFCLDELLKKDISSLNIYRSPRALKSLKKTMNNFSGEGIPEKVKQLFKKLEEIYVKSGKGTLTDYYIDKRVKEQKKEDDLMTFEWMFLRDIHSLKTKDPGIKRETCKSKTVGNKSPDKPVRISSSPKQMSGKSSSINNNLTTENPTCELSKSDRIPDVECTTSSPQENKFKETSSPNRKRKIEEPQDSKILASPKRPGTSISQTSSADITEFDLSEDHILNVPSPEFFSQSDHEESKISGTEEPAFKRNCISQDLPSPPSSPRLFICSSPEATN